jgi:hypothetical protein
MLNALREEGSREDILTALADMTAKRDTLRAEVARLRAERDKANAVRLLWGMALEGFLAAVDPEAISAALADTGPDPTKPPHSGREPVNVRELVSAPSPIAAAVQAIDWNAKALDIWRRAERASQPHSVIASALRAVGGGLAAALEEIAKQRMSDDMDQEERNNADWMFGYDACVERARAALRGD